MVTNHHLNTTAAEFSAHLMSYFKTPKIVIFLVNTPSCCLFIFTSDQARIQQQQRTDVLCVFLQQRITLCSQSPVNNQANNKQTLQEANLKVNDQRTVLEDPLRGNKEAN